MWTQGIPRVLWLINWSDLKFPYLCCCLVAHSGVILQLSDYYSLIPLIHSWNRDRRNSSLLNLSRHIEAALQRVRLLIKQCTHNHDKYYADNHRPLLPQQFQQYSRNTEAQDFYMSGVRMNKRYLLSPRKLIVAFLVFQSHLLNLQWNWPTCPDRGELRGIYGETYLWRYWKIWLTLDLTQE